MKLHGRGKSLAVGPLSSLVRVKRVRVNVVVSRLLGSNCKIRVRVNVVVSRLLGSNCKIRVRVNVVVSRLLGSNCNANDTLLEIIKRKLRWVGHVVRPKANPSYGVNLRGKDQEEGNG